MVASVASFEPQAGDWGDIMGMEQEPENIPEIARTPRRRRSNASADIDLDNADDETPRFKRSKTAGVRSRLRSSIKSSNKLNSELALRSPGAAECTNLVDVLLRNTPAAFGEEDDFDRAPKSPLHQYDWERRRNHGKYDYSEDAQNLGASLKTPPQKGRKRAM